MKTISKIFLLSGLLSACFISCKKNSSTGTAAIPTVTLSKSVVKLGEPLMATANQASSQALIKWSVNPAVNAWINSTNNKSVILFSSPGNYTVTANYYTDSSTTTPYDSSSSPVAVNDSLYGDSTVRCDAIISAPMESGDQVILTPVSYADTGLVLLAHTQKMYADFPSLGNIQPAIDNEENYEFTFNNTILEYPCLGSSGPSPATTVLPFGALGNGTHTLTVLLNGITYEGSILVTSTDFTFTWTYTSGVILSTLHINK